MAEEGMNTGTIIEALREMKLALEEAAKSRIQMVGEIKRLRQRVKELEQKLKQRHLVRVSPGAVNIIYA